MVDTITYLRLCESLDESGAEIEELTDKCKQLEKALESVFEVLTDEESDRVLNEHPEIEDYL